MPRPSTRREKREKDLQHSHAFVVRVKLAVAARPETACWWLRCMATLLLGVFDGGKTGRFFQRESVTLPGAY